MKKMLVIIAALIMAAACAAPPPNREAAPPANTSSPVAEVALSEADATAKEKAIWEAIKSKDYDAFAAMLAPDQLEVIAEGVMDKAGSLVGVKQFEPSEVNFSEWKYLPIGKDAFVVTYTIAVKGKFQGKEFPLQTARASSAWVKRDGKWLAIYHQECEVPAKLPPMRTSETAAATPATTPAPPPVTGADPIANEKIVWDLFKAKNYDAFAELLAPEFIEIEPDAYYDRAGTKKSVSMFDASKVEVSDFQSANLTPDAALVVYTAKGPAPFSPAGQRHSTIWVRRDGKWLGLLHHGGTPVRKAVPPPPAPAAKAPEKAKTP